MKTDLQRFQAAILADPTRQWLAGLVGSVVGADDALRQYDALFAVAWQQHDALAALQPLADTARLLEDAYGRTLSTTDSMSKTHST